MGCCIIIGHRCVARLIVWVLRNDKVFVVMCGIAGVFPFSNRGVCIDTEIVDQMIALLAHRGPDAKGVWNATWGAVLGHRRLTIIDLSEDANQPFVSDDGNYVISFNGEIYNYLDLRKELETHGFVFHTNSDTEVLLNAYIQWGEGCLPRIDGMYAFAILNECERSLFLARDPFGEKPLYLYEYNRNLFFASELKAFTSIPGWDGAISDGAISEYLSLQYIDAPRTIYSNVSKLNPGSWVRYTYEGERKEGVHFKYEPCANKTTETEEELLEELEEILVRSLKRRLIADVPIGLFLSGGIDSSLVAALVAKKMGRNIKSFSLGFEGSEESEHLEARLIAKTLGLDHYEQLLNREVLSDYQRIGSVVDEPNGDTSLLPTWYLCEFTRKHVKVALSGDGGDELFLGYNRHLEYLARNSKSDPISNVKEIYYGNSILVHSPKEIRDMMGSLPSSFGENIDLLESEIISGPLSLADKLRKTDLRHYMPGAVLAKVDRMSMQHGLEVRTPFLSREVSKFSEKLGYHHLVNNGKGKYLLRKLLARYLSDDHVNRRKSGFGIPGGEWGRQGLIEDWNNELKDDQKRFWWLAGQNVPSSVGTYQIWTLLILAQYLSVNRFSLFPVSLSIETANWLRNVQGRSDIVIVTKKNEPSWVHLLPQGTQIIANADISSLRFEKRSYYLIDKNPPVKITRKNRGLLDLDSYLSSKTYNPFRLPILYNEIEQEAYPISRFDAWRQLRKSLRVTFGLNLSSDEHRELLFGGEYALWTKKTPRRAVQLLGELNRWIRMLFREKLAFQKARKIENIATPRKVSRIALVIDSLGSGGAERQLVLLALELKKMGFDVLVLVLKPLIGSNAHYRKVLVENEVTSESLADFSAARLPRDYLSQQSDVLKVINYFPKSLRETIWKLTLRLQLYEPDAVHSHLDYSNIIAGWSGIFAQVPSVGLSFRNVNPSNFEFHRDWFRRHYKELLNYDPIRLCGNSSYGNADYASWLGIEESQIELTPNGIKTGQFAPNEEQGRIVRERHGIHDDDFVILGVFRLSPEKRPLDFVNVCARVLEQFPTAHVFLLGEGVLEHEVLKHIETLGLTSQFHFEGAVSDVEHYCNASDVILLCSECEGTPNVLLEAQSCGVPVVATDAGGVGEIVSNGNTGLIFPIGDVKQLSEGIISLFSNERLFGEMSSQARNWILDQFEMSGSAKNIVRIHDVE